MYPPQGSLLEPGVGSIGRGLRAVMLERRPGMRMPAKHHKGKAAKEAEEEEEEGKGRHTGKGGGGHQKGRETGQPSAQGACGVIPKGCGQRGTADRGPGFNVPTRKGWLADWLWLRTRTFVHHLLGVFLLIRKFAPQHSTQTYLVTLR